MRLLLLEDDAELLSVIAARLRYDGFAVDETNRLATAEDAMRLHDYDCLVLDRLVPDGDALDLVADRRPGARSPVLFLTAMDTVPDRVAGFEAGADDYLTKPFALDELVARVRALCRRRGRPRASRATIGDMDVDRASRTVRRGGVRLSLTPKEYALLEVLVESAGAVVSREELIERCWDVNANIFSNSVNVHMASLRRKLGPPELIKTVRGGGYTLDAPEPS